MRLWSIHPRYLDRQGLTACWREALLAQAVLAGRTRGYTKHPQLERFRTVDSPGITPLSAIGSYLEGLQREASSRGYRFNNSLILSPDQLVHIEVSSGQVAFEREHLLRKLHARSPEFAALVERDSVWDVHPIFVTVPGDVASWERDKLLSSRL